MKTLLQFLVVPILLCSGAAGMAQTGDGTAGMTDQEYVKWLSEQTVVGPDAFEGHEDIKDVELLAVEELTGATFEKLNNVQRLVLGSADRDVWIVVCWHAMRGEWSTLKELRIYQPLNDYSKVDYSEGHKMYYEYLPYVVWNNTPALTDLTLPDEANIIMIGSFYNCESLSEITLPKCISHIENGAFYNCTALTTVTVPTPMPPSLGERAFCSDLINDKRKQITVVVPAGFGEIYSAAPGWSEFKEIVEDESLVYDFDPANLPQHPDGRYELRYGNGFQYFRTISDEDKTAMLVSDKYYVSGYDGDVPDFRATKVYYELWPHLDRDNDIAIGGYATTLDGDKYTITEIGPYAYNGYPLSTEVCIPPTVQRIRHGAFGHQCDLVSVCTRAIEPPLVDDDSVFGDKSELALYVPQGCGEAYAEAAVWRDFGSITEDPTLGSAAVITIDAEPSDAPATYYGLDGRLLRDGAPARGLCIERRADGTARLVGRR